MMCNIIFFIDLDIIIIAYITSLCSIYRFLSLFNYIIMSYSKKNIQIERI